MTLYTGLDNGTLTINPAGMNAGEMEVVLPGPAWGGDFVLSALWGPADQRGSSILIPYADGRRAVPRRRDETTRDLPFTITGECDPDGEANEDFLVGLQENWEYLVENLGDPPPSGATREAVLVMPDTSERTADVQTQLLGGEQVDHYMRAVLRLTIPAGYFEPSGS